MFSELETLPVPPTDTRTLPVGTNGTHSMEPLIFNMFVPSLPLANPSPSIEAMQEQSNGGIALDTSRFMSQLSLSADSMSQRNASSTRNVPVVTQTLGM